MQKVLDARGFEIQEMGLGVVIFEDIAGYAVVKIDGKVKKRFTNKKEDAWGDAYRFASNVFYEKQREKNEHIARNNK